MKINSLKEQILDARFWRNAVKNTELCIEMFDQGIAF
jgi:hypothetical protein